MADPEGLSSRRLHHVITCQSPSTERGGALGIFLNIVLRAATPSYPSSFSSLLTLWPSPVLTPHNSRSFLIVTASTSASCLPLLTFMGSALTPSSTWEKPDPEKSTFKAQGRQ